VRRRFFVERFEEGKAVLRGEPAHHLSRVLRAEPGQLYELSDSQAVWLARVESSRQDAVEFSLVEQIPVDQPTLRVTLFLSIIKFDRFEWCLEKATELGADKIIPLAAGRSEKALIAAAAKRARRWEKILTESAQQARCLRPPVLAATSDPAEAFARERASIRILLSESREAQPLRICLERTGSGPRSFPCPRPVAVALAIGPEGGWTEPELKAARTAGFVGASLGSDIQRTETAVIAALAILNYALGD
jgi:16S rRNA (uracil1498-N3)-methyltransferase